MKEQRSWWDRWIAVWLLSYPRRFRRQFGSDLATHYPQPERRRAWAAALAGRDLLRGGLGARSDDLRRLLERHAGWDTADSWRVDVRQALRGFIRRPLFTATIVATLALAASLNAVVFSLVNATLLRPLPYPDEGAIVSIGSVWTGYTHTNVSMPEYFDYRERARSFSAIAAYGIGSINLVGGDREPERIQAVRATSSFFSVLGTYPERGRLYSAEEDADGAELAIISHEFWLRRFGGDPGVIGRTLTTDSGAREIVGVMPPTFRMPSDETQVWLPLGATPANAGNRGAHNRLAIARLRPGVTLPQARDEMLAIAKQLQTEYPRNYPEGSGWSLSVLPLRERLVGHVRDPLLMLAAAVAMVWLIAAANVANVIGARGIERMRELAIQSALGASRRRLTRQALMEGLLTGACGGIAGLLLAVALTAIVGRWIPPSLPRPEHVLSDRRVILFALCTTALTGLVCAWTTLRGVSVQPARALQSARSTGDAKASFNRTLLTGLEVALAVALLIAGGLAMQSFKRLIETDPGISSRDIATARVTLSSTRYSDDDRRIAFFVRAHEALVRQPGVIRAGAVSLLPLTGQGSDWTFAVHEWVPPSADFEPTEQTRVVLGDYFQTMDIPLLEGRFFEPRDTRAAPRVAMVSASFARKYWPGRTAMGRGVRLWGHDSVHPWAAVVGVVGDIRNRELSEESVPFLYFPATQVMESMGTFVAKLEPGHRKGPQVIGDAIREIDPQQPIWAPSMMEDWLDRSIARPRFDLMLLGIFGAAAVSLAATGIYGVLASGVSRRTKEFGVRIALGADPRSLMRMVLRQTVALTLVASAVGSIAAALAASYVGSVFYRFRVADPVVFAAAGLFVLLVALVAAWVPARRSMRVDPIVALRVE